MDEIRNLVKEVLEQAYILSLATIDEGGLWVSDLVFVYDDQFNIYWLSAEDIRHSQAILKNNRVAASVTVSNNQGEDNIGLQLAGTVEKIDGDILAIATKHRLKRKKPAPKLGEILENNTLTWYKLKPTKIQLIYEPLWGFEKKDLNLENL